MGIDHLEKIFHPEAVAVVGDFEHRNAPARAIMANLVQADFPGSLFPVDRESRSVMGRRAVSALPQIDEPVDLVVAAVPMPMVPAVIGEAARLRAAGAVIVSTGENAANAEGRKIETQIRQGAGTGGMRVIGPHSPGIMCAAAALNASCFAPGMPLGGNAALVSQSGAMATALLDFSIKERIGFSHVICPGAMLDVDFADIIDYLGADPAVRSIVLYAHTLTRPRRFLSAARAVSRVKPIIILKAGRSRAGAAAVASHTGAVAGEDAVYDAAFERAGIIRVQTFEELFDAAEILSCKARFRGPGLAIVTNAGGPGVMAADALAGCGQTPAVLEEETVAKLDAVLPAGWGRQNPVDIFADATPRRYAAAVEILARAPGVNGILAIFVPRTPSRAEPVARALAEGFATDSMPLIASWMGGANVEAGRDLLNQAGIATFDTPERAVRAFMNLHRHARGIEMLQQIPPKLARRIEVDKETAQTLIDRQMDGPSGRMAEAEAKALLAAYGIPVCPTGPVPRPDCQLIVGIKKDPDFGPVICFGLGGMPARLFQDRAMALPPLNRLLAARLMEGTRAHRLLRGNRERLEEILVRLSQLAVDFPQIEALEINPMTVTPDRILAVNARVRVKDDPRAAPLHLAISPYPAEQESMATVDGAGLIRIRPIRPEDAPLLEGLFHTLSPQSVYFRFFTPMKTFSPALLARFTQIDYDREIALVAVRENGLDETMLGAARVIMMPSRKEAEFAVVVGDPWHGKGIGARLLSRCLEIAKARQVEKIWGTVLADNRQMIALARKLGFTVRRSSQAGEYEMSLGMDPESP